MWVLPPVSFFAFELIIYLRLYSFIYLFIYLWFI